MNTQTVIAGHIKAAIRIAEQAECDSIASRMRKASGKPSGKNGPTLPDLYSLKWMCIELPKGYPREAAAMHIQACCHILLDELAIDALRIWEKLSRANRNPATESLGAKAAMDALQRITSATCYNMPPENELELIRAIDTLCSAIESIPASDLYNLDALDKTIVRERPKYMRGVVNALRKTNDIVA